MSAPKVVIVGAGLSGLVAAKELAARGCRVTVLERSCLPGGQLMSWRDPDLGGGAALERATHGVWWSYTNLRRLLGDLDVALRARWVNEPHRRLPVVGGDGITRSYRIGVGLPSVTHAAATMLSLRRRLGQPLPPRALAALVAFDPHDDDDIALMDSLSARDWAERVGLPEAFVQDVMEPLLQMCNFASAEDSSALAWHRYLSAHLASWKDLRIVQFFERPTGEDFVPALLRAAQDAGATVHLGVTVDQLELDGQRVVAVRTAARDHDDSTCPACMAPAPARVCARCGFAGIERLRGTSRAERIDCDAVLLAPSAPAAAELTRPFRTDPFFAALGQVRTVRPTIVYLEIEGSSQDAWRAAHGRQEVLFSSRFAALGTVIHLNMLRGATAGGRGQLIEVDLPASHADTPDAELVARVSADLQRAVPGLGRTRVARVHRVDGFGAALPGDERHRPTVTTPVDGLLLAGDWVRPAQPAFFMERCVVTALEAVRSLCAAYDLRTPPTILPSGHESRTLRWLRRGLDARSLARAR